MKLVLAFLFLFEAGAHAVAVKSRSGEVSFLAKGNPGFMKIEGKSSGGLTGELDPGNTGAPGVFTFAMKNLGTGIELRDEHMKEKYLEVGKHPKAIFELVEIKLPNPLPAGDFEKDAPFKGKLTVKGVTKEVSGVAKLKKEGSNLTGNVEFATTVKSFNIELPSFAGITMADEVNVQVEFTGPMVQKTGTRSLASKR